MQRKCRGGTSSRSESWVGVRKYLFDRQDLKVFNPLDTRMRIRPVGLWPHGGKQLVFRTRFRSALHHLNLRNSTEFISDSHCSESKFLWLRVPGTSHVSAQRNRGVRGETGTRTPLPPAAAPMARAAGARSRVETPWGNSTWFPHLCRAREGRTLLLQQTGFLVVVTPSVTRPYCCKFWRQSELVSFSPERGR